LGVVRDEWVEGGGKVVADAEGDAAELLFL